MGSRNRSFWYEYLILDGKIPRFDSTDEGLDLGLHKRKFKTGTAIKLYSYNLPTGFDTAINIELRKGINEYLFKPALPIFMIETPKRYPKDHQLERELYGLKHRLDTS